MKMKSPSSIGKNVSTAGQVSSDRTSRLQPSHTSDASANAETVEMNSEIDQYKNLAKAAARLGETERPGKRTVPD